MVTGPISTRNFGDSLAIQPDGKIVLSGYTGANPNSTDFALVRYNSNGSLDASFGSGGFVTTDFFGLADFGRTVLVLPDGMLLVVGSAFIAQNSPGFALARYTANGALDTSFGSGGKVTTAFPGASAGGRAGRL